MQERKIDGNRRSFLKTSTAMLAVGVIGKHGNIDLSARERQQPTQPDQTKLYNGISLPSEWPPRSENPESYDPMPVPYPSNPPKVIPIDIGRQLFVDDFLIEKTDLDRTFHQPEKHTANPLLVPSTAVEMNQGYCPMAAPFSDGCFYDPKDQLFKMWYMAGWFDGTALAVSDDGLSWRKEKLDVVPGTNLVLPPGESRDGVSVWLDHESANPTERFKMYRFERKGKVGEKLTGGAAYIMTSPDGIHWKWNGQVGKTGDNSTFFYNPFRKKWVFTVRAFGRPAPPWNPDTWNNARRGRARSYWENSDFKAAVGGWKDYDPVFWLGADRLDEKRERYPVGHEPQLYKIDAAGYESLMIGFIQLHYGPPNSDCRNGGFPKLTELQLAFSRDGFHWDRSNRKTFIAGTLKENNWERAYIHSIGGVCNIVDDKLYFYYTAFQGDSSNRNELQYWSGMYANASTGLAVLRRDGFASMDTRQQAGFLLTKPIQFSGEYLFLNVDAGQGKVEVEICDEEGYAIAGFEHKNCDSINEDSTKIVCSWQGNEKLTMLRNRIIRFKFFLQDARLFAFWVSSNYEGMSGGATAGGGPGITGTWDN